MEHIFMDPWDLELISFQVYVTEKMATQASTHIYCNRMVLESGTKNCLVPLAHLFPGAIKCNALTGAPTEAEHGTWNLSPAQAPLTVWSCASSINQHTAGSRPKEPTEQCLSRAPGSACSGSLRDIWRRLGANSWL